MPPPRPKTNADTDTDEGVMRFRLDGVEYTLDMLGISAEMSRFYRRLTGTSVVADMNGLQDGDPSAIVALVWAARWQAGEKIPVSVVDDQLGSIGKVGDVEFEILDDADDADDPTGEKGELDPES